MQMLNWSIFQVLPFTLSKHEYALKLFPPLNFTFSLIYWDYWTGFPLPSYARTHREHSYQPQTPMTCSDDGHPSRAVEWWTPDLRVGGSAHEREHEQWVQQSDAQKVSVKQHTLSGKPAAAAQQRVITSLISRLKSVQQTQESTAERMNSLSLPLHFALCAARASWGKLLACLMNTDCFRAEE